MILVQKGENFKFEQQLHNGRDDRFIKLELIDTVTSNIIGTYSLNHVNGGWYEKKDLPASQDGVYLARYTVYKDVGLTRPDKKYQIKLDYFRVESIIEQLENIIDLGDGSTA